MNPERWKEIDTVLARALDLPPSRRAVYLATAYAHDRPLQAAVEALLDDNIERATDARFAAAAAAAASLMARDNSE